MSKQKCTYPYQVLSKPKAFYVCAHHSLLPQSQCSQSRTDKSQMFQDSWRWSHSCLGPQHLLPCMLPQSSQLVLHLLTAVK